MLEGIAARIKEFARKLTGAESRILIKDADVLKKFAKELNTQLDTSGNQTQKNTAQGGVKFSFEDTQHGKESKFIADSIYNYISKISDKSTF